MTPDQYRTHQINLAVDRALTTAMAYGHAEYAHGGLYGGLAIDDPSRDAQRATVQDRYDRLTQIINELRDLALNAAKEG